MDNINLSQILDQIMKWITLKFDLVDEKLFEEHLSIMCCELNVDTEILLHSCIILNKYYIINNDINNIYTSALLYVFIIALQLSSKFIRDEIFTNRQITDHYKLSYDKFQDNELHVLSFLNWNLFITNDDIANISSLLNINRDACTTILSSVLSR